MSFSLELKDFDEVKFLNKFLVFLNKLSVLDNIRDRHTPMYPWVTEVRKCMCNNNVYFWLSRR
jgi:hypothetical protein